MDWTRRPPRRRPTPAQGSAPAPLAPARARQRRTAGAPVAAGAGRHAALADAASPWRAEPLSAPARRRRRNERTRGQQKPKRSTVMHGRGCATYSLATVARRFPSLLLDEVLDDAIRMGCGHVICDDARAAAAGHGSRTWHARVAIGGGCSSGCCGSGSCCGSGGCRARLRPRPRSVPELRLWLKLALRGLCRRGSGWFRRWCAARRRAGIRFTRLW